MLPMIGSFTAAFDTTPLALSDILTETGDIATKAFDIGGDLISFVLTNWILTVPLALAILYFAWNGVRKLIRGV